MNTLALSPRLTASSDSLKLSDGRCVRWFVEALQLLRRFDETTSKDALGDARTLLQKCVDHYPQDLLPKFYLAIAESVLGDLVQNRAIPLFEACSRSDQFEMSAAAKYNLAAAYIETYDVNCYEKAVSLLDELIGELQKYGAPMGIPNWLVPVQALFSGRRIRVEQLYYQALEVRTYARLRIWDPQPMRGNKSLKELGEESLAELEQRRAVLEKRQKYLDGQRSEIWAWNWNTTGGINRVFGVSARQAGNARLALQLSDKAVEAYLLAIKNDPSFSSARVNLGRINLEQGRKVDAEKFLLEALEGVEDIDYANFNLGLLYTWEGKKEPALRHFAEAPIMLKRENQDLTWVGARMTLSKLLIDWGHAAEAQALLAELAQENRRSAGLRQTIEDLIKKLTNS
jgi:tetratricopeptide (TPR) repeat protein